MSIILNGTTGITTPSIDAAAGNADLTTMSVAGNEISAVNSTGFRNRLINSDMRIDQRNAGASVTPTSSAYTIDRWRLGASVASKVSVQRSTVVPEGFTNSTLITSLSAYTITGSEEINFGQRIEGFNVSDLGWGTANAKPVTLSFWVRSSLTGLFSGAIKNNDANRGYPFSYTISAANTWEQKTITIAGDTTGTWETGTNTGIVAQFCISAAANLFTAGVWAASNVSGVTGTTQLVATSGATFYITGVQLEAGSVATPFERRSYGQELALCQRYYAKTYNIETLPGTATYTGSITARVGNTESYNYAGYFTFPVSMRTSPSITIYAPGTGASGNATNNSLGNFAAIVTQPSGTAGVNIQSNGISTSQVTSNYSHVVASAEL